MSLAKTVGTSLSDLLKTVTVANGYKTDIGNRVYRGRLAIDDTRIPCVIFAEMDDINKDETSHGTMVLVDQRYTIEAHVECDPDNPNDAAHDAIEDIKRVMFQHLTKVGTAFSKEIRKLSYTGKSISPRPDGSRYVAGSVTVVASFAEDLRNP
jgi:hypothetical protein